jgi:hypothetical protein
MAALPKVAIVGRPNVGKSAMFNRLAGSTVSVVYDYPGVTRDRIYTRAFWGDKEFVLIDTGARLLRPRRSRWQTGGRPLHTPAHEPRSRVARPQPPAPRLRPQPGTRAKQPPGGLMSDAARLPGEQQEAAMRSIGADGLPAAIERQAAAGALRGLGAIGLC